MKLNQADTQLGVKFNVVEFEDTDILSMVTDPTKLARVTDCVNADRRQKIALVDARFDLSEKITAITFSRLTKQITKDNVSVTVPAETEGEHIKRFTDALVKGTFETPGFTLPSGDEKQKETAAYAFLQSIASTCGDKTFNNQPAYVLDITKAVRKPGTGLIAKWAMDAAATIIKNGNQAAWVTKFTSGYTSPRGIAIPPITFGDFTAVAAHHSTPEQVQAVHETNQKNLAKAIAEVRRIENDLMQPEFA